MIYLHGRAQLVCQPNKHLLICTKCSSAQWKFQNHGLSYFESSFQFLYFISSIILLLIPLLLRGKALSERLQAKTCPFCGDMLYFTEAHDKWSPNLCVEFTDTNRNMIGAVMWMHWNVWAIGGGRLLIYTYKKSSFTPWCNENLYSDLITWSHHKKQAQWRQRFFLHKTQCRKMQKE